MLSLRKTTIGQLRWPEQASLNEVCLLRYPGKYWTRIPFRVLVPFPTIEGAFSTKLVPVLVQSHGPNLEPVLSVCFHWCYVSSLAFVSFSCSLMFYIRCWVSAKCCFTAIFNDGVCSIYRTSSKQDVKLSFVLPFLLISTRYPLKTSASFAESIHTH